MLKLNVEYKLFPKITSVDIESGWASNIPMSHMEKKNSIQIV